LFKRIFAIFSLCAIWAAAPAHAATTVYVDSSSPLYGGFANAVNSGNALGPADGASAFVPTGGFIAFQVVPFFTDVNFNMTFTGVSGAGTVRLYVGRTNGAGGFTALNSRFFTVSSGVFNFSSTVLTNYCIGLGGCDTFITQAWTGTTFSLDSVPNVNPEPSAWALMIMSFAGVSWRMKRLRAVGKLAPKRALFA